MYPRPLRLVVAASVCWPIFFENLTARAAETEKKPGSYPADLPDFHWHLTARPWRPVNAPRGELLGQMEAAVRALADFQYWNAEDVKDLKNGAIIDPYDNKEIQYGTPCFAFNVATLLAHGYGADLAKAGVRALDRATLDISSGFVNDYHGEFYAAPMVKAIELFESVKGKYPEITDEKLALWKKRMTVEREKFMTLRVRQNWRTFASKGEWLRQKDGYITDAVPWIEGNWNQKVEGGQRERFHRDQDKYGMSPYFYMYHDDTADPETFAYNGATTANLLDMLENGYDGPSAQDIRTTIERTLHAALLLLSGAGEAPAGGRTGEHIWDDSIYANAFQLMSEVEWRGGDKAMAGEYRHAVELLLKSHARFQQENGLFSITKNLFPAALKNRYAPWSGVANYEDFTISCCGEVLGAAKTKIPEQPIPSEIGGYAVKLDPTYANDFIDAGGMQAQICTRGETDHYGNVQWHTLGITRFSRVGWDGRLGPGAGHTNEDFSDGVSFSPAFLENGVWKRVSVDPKRFQGSFTADFVHPLLVRGTYTISPAAGQSGPAFTMKITLTPDGALVDTSSTSAKDFGVIWPLFQFDGRTVLNTSVAGGIASTAYPHADAKEIVIQAEDAVLSGSAQVGAGQPGFHGKGFVQMPLRGSAIEWSSLDGGAGGATEVGFRYSLGWDKTTVRKAKLYVNGEEQPELNFLATGDWRHWHELYLPVKLAAGAANTVRLVCDDGEGGGFIDELRVRPAAPSAPEPDQENFIALNKTDQLDTSAPTVRGGYGDFLPVRVSGSQGGTVETFVYPRSAGDPDAESVRASFKRDGENFASVLGRVKGTLYVGRTSAGGVGAGIDLKGDGKEDVTFNHPCGFILQLKDGRVTAIEADQAVEAKIGGRSMRLSAYKPVSIK